MEEIREKGFSLGIVLVAISLLISTLLLKQFLQVPNVPVNQTTTVSPLVIKQPMSTQSAKLRAEQLTKYLTVETAFLGVSDNISLYFKSLTDGDEVTLQDSRSWIPASTIKSFVLLEAFRQKRSGILDFNKVVTIVPQNVVPTEMETNDYQPLLAGTQVSVEQLMEMMITQSDNTAYNTLLDVLDRRNINDTLRQLGFTETVVGEKLNLDDEQFQKDLQVPGRQPNTTTVKDFATLFDLLYHDRVQGSPEILGIFKKQKINNMIPALLPGNIVVAHKTGDWAPIYHDGGVIYKPGDPFILTVFTNSNDPTVLAKLARVAYFQTAVEVGQKLDVPDKPISNLLKTKQVLSYAPASNVLAAADSKVPEVTAEDLGITTSDINLGPEKANGVAESLIMPGSLAYNLKRWFQDQQLQNATTEQDKVEAYLDQSNARLSELKTALKLGDFNLASDLLNQSEQDLKLAAQSGSKATSADVDLLRVKQSTDLNFSVLADQAGTIPANQKEQFIDLVYNFYQKNQQEVKSVTQASLITHPLQQQPLIGTIEKIDHNNLTLQFEDGSQKQVQINDFTPTRQFQDQTLDQGSEKLKVNSKVAIVGQITENGTIVPQFILRDLPKEVPEKHQGVILEVDPAKQTLKIDDNGQEQQVKVNPETVVKSKDTNVSLEGINAGSSVTVFGQSSSNASPNTQGQSGNNTINASSVTVTQNSGSTSQKDQPKPKDQPKKDDSKKEPPPKPDENKKPEPAPTEDSKKR